MLKRNGLILVLLMITFSTVFGQKERVMNLQKFDHRVTHFGFLLGVNSADFVLHRYSPEPGEYDSLFVIEPTKTTGFNIGIISALHFNPNVSLRFTPNLAFAQRGINYTFQTLEGPRQYKKPIESTLINFPLNIKFKSDRLNNFSAYIIGGAAYSLDLASDESAENRSANLNDVFLKLKKHDYMGEIGVGTDFYLEYFKFGLELKMSYGIKDILVRDNTIFSDPIEKLKSKMFLLSYTFEG